MPKHMAGAALDGLLKESIFQHIPVLAGTMLGGNMPRDTVTSK